VAWMAHLHGHPLGDCSQCVFARSLGGRMRADADTWLTVRRGVMEVRRAQVRSSHRDSWPITCGGARQGAVLAYSWRWPTSATNLRPLCNPTGTSVLRNGLVGADPLSGCPPSPLPPTRFHQQLARSHLPGHRQFYRPGRPAMRSQHAETASGWDRRRSSHHRASPSPNQPRAQREPWKQMGMSVRPTEPGSACAVRR
jgi:hypothetical protein